MRVYVRKHYKLLASGPRPYPSTPSVHVSNINEQEGGRKKEKERDEFPAIYVQVFYSFFVASVSSYIRTSIFIPFLLPLFVLCSMVLVSLGSEANKLQYTCQSSFIYYDTRNA